MSPPDQVPLLAICRKARAPGCAGQGGASPLFVGACRRGGRSGDPAVRPRRRTSDLSVARAPSEATAGVAQRHASRLPDAIVGVGLAVASAHGPENARTDSRNTRARPAAVEGAAERRRELAEQSPVAADAREAAAELAEAGGRCAPRREPQQSENNRQHQGCTQNQAGLHVGPPQFSLWFCDAGLQPEPSAGAAPPQAANQPQPYAQAIGACSRGDDAQPATSTSTAPARPSARRDSCHSRNSPEPTTTAEPINRPMVGTSPQMANPKMTAHTSER